MGMEHSTNKTERNLKRPPGSQKKDESYEWFIRDFNAHIAPFEEERYQELDESLPSLHIVGVPRSGTTLMTQLVCSYLDVGYINNLIARFWKAPVTGIQISQHLLDTGYRSTFSSEYGKTAHIQEPHEFNYFWADQLEYDEEFIVKSEAEAEKIDWNRVATVLKNILHAYNKPVAFKSFLLGWHAHLIYQQLQKTCFVWIRRDPVDNAMSLLKTRKLNFNGIDEWSTLKPANYEALKELTPWEQVAAQVYYMEQTYRNQLARLPSKNYRIVQYEDVCRDPTASLTAIRKMLMSHGAEVRMNSFEFPELSPSVSGPHKAEDRKKIRQALEKYDYLHSSPPQNV
jgi:hypothetical protein